MSSFRVNLNVTMSAIIWGRPHLTGLSIIMGVAAWGESTLRRSLVPTQPDERQD